MEHQGSPEPDVLKRECYRGDPVLRSGHSWRGCTSEGATALGAGSVLGSSKLSLRCAYRGFCLTFRVNFCFFPCTHLSPFCCFQGDIAGVQSWATLRLTQELYSCSQVSQELSSLTRSQLPTSPTSLALQGPTPPPFLLGTPLASTGHSRLSLGEVISF